MVRQCFIARSGVLFDRNKLAKALLPPDVLYPNVELYPETDAAASVSAAQLKKQELKDANEKDSSDEEGDDDDDSSQKGGGGIQRIFFRLIPG